MTSNDKFSKRFKKSYENIKNLHLSKSISSSELVNKFSNEIDKAAYELMESGAVSKLTSEINDNKTYVTQKDNYTKELYESLHT